MEGLVVVGRSGPVLELDGGDVRGTQRVAVMAEEVSAVLSPSGSLLYVVVDHLQGLRDRGFEFGPAEAVADLLTERAERRVRGRKERIDWRNLHRHVRVLRDEAPNGLCVMVEPPDAASGASKTPAQSRSNCRCARVECFADHRHATDMLVVVAHAAGYVRVALPGSRDRPCSTSWEVRQHEQVPVSDPIGLVVEHGPTPPSRALRWGERATRTTVVSDDPEVLVGLPSPALAETAGA